MSPFHPFRLAPRFMIRHGRHREPHWWKKLPGSKSASLSMISSPSQYSLSPLPRGGPWPMVLVMRELVEGWRGVCEVQGGNNFNLGFYCAYCFAT